MNGSQSRKILIVLLASKNLIGGDTMIKVTIDGITVEVEQGSTILEAAKIAGV